MHNAIKTLNVFWNELLMGRLQIQNRRIIFEYDAAFIKHDIQLSPFYLPLKLGAQQADTGYFEGLFGLFNDSLPDGWGRLLLDRKVRTSGIDVRQLSPLDRLAYVGQHGMGALRYEPDLGDITPVLANVDLATLAHESQCILQGDEYLFEELFQLCGSSAGARPKVMLGINQAQNDFIYGINAVPHSYEHWLVKFNNSSDTVDIGAIEYAYSLMAKQAGLIMPETACFKTDNQTYGYFGIKRFDRNHNLKIHMHSLSGLLHADHRVPTLDYQDILKATWLLTHNQSEVEKMYRLAVFNILAHNRDDHSKNFSFLMNNNGQWHTAPAYDLTFSYGPGGEHSTTIMNEGRHPSAQHCLALAKLFDIPHACDIIMQTQSAVAHWPNLAKQTGVSTRSINAINKSLEYIARLG